MLPAKARLPLVNTFDSLVMKRLLAKVLQPLVLCSRLQSLA
jgi:hypothetical protein